LGFAIANPSAAVESATTAQVPARTGALAACKTMSVLACAKVGDKAVHATKLVAKNVTRKSFRKLSTGFSR
jgi:hypothetical protein